MAHQPAEFRIGIRLLVIGQRGNVATDGDAAFQVAITQRL